jgi:acyl-CoA synthetase (NDP forming)
MPVQIARSWRRPIRLITGVSSRLAPFGRTVHAQRILVPPGTGSKVSVPAMSAMLPVLTVHARRSAPGQRAAASHTAAAVAPLITRQALFDQAGIIATTSFGELLDAVALVASQPIPAGSTVAIVSNGGGAAMLTADACAEAGLTVAATSPATRGRLREVLPPGRPSAAR